ncbi:unnamed protein product [Sphacelaria rigidula]
MQRKRREAKTVRNVLSTDTGVGSMARANAILLSKLEASRLHALGALSSVLFDEGRRGCYASCSSPTRTARFPSGTRGARAGESHSPSRGDGGRPGSGAASEMGLEQRLRSKAVALVEEERQRLALQLQRELLKERKAFEARKAGISEEVNNP